MTDPLDVILDLSAELPTGLAYDGIEPASPEPGQASSE